MTTKANRVYQRCQQYLEAAREQIERFKVAEKISDVVVKLRNIRTGTSKTLHTDKFRIIHENNITQQQHRNVRRAYPVHEDKEMNETQMPTNH